MKLVLDTSVAVKVVVPEPNSDKAVALIADYQKGIHELIAPDFLHIEVSNALTRAARGGLITVVDAEEGIKDLIALGPVVYRSSDLLKRAVEISFATRSSVYDCLFVALSEREGCDVITADQKLINNLPGFPIRDLATM